MYGSVKAIAFLGGILQQLVVVGWLRAHILNLNVIARNEAISALADQNRNVLLSLPLQSRAGSAWPKSE